MNPFFLCLTIGLVAGVLAGFFGVGGGLIIVPLLVFLFGFSQKTANGMSLVALLAPAGLFAVINYYRAGVIQSSHLKLGLIISLGMFGGAYVGSKIAISIPEFWLKRAFCVFLVLVAIRMWLSTTRPLS